MNDQTEIRQPETEQNETVPATGQAEKEKSATSQTGNGKNESGESEAKDKKQKVGVYICYCGGNISDHVDVEAVRERMEKLPDVAISRTNMFMCSDPGQELIIEDLKNGLVDRVVVASCAPSLHETTFRSAIERAGANPFIYEHANIREQVSWVHHGDPATDKATTLVAAAAAKAGLLKPLEPVRVDAKKHTTVIGGGISGMTTALGIADKGIDVALIEKTSAPGGMLNRLDRLAPTGEYAADIIEKLTRKINAHKRITLHTDCDIVDVTGYVGNFVITIKNNRNTQKGAGSKTSELKNGAIKTGSIAKGTSETELHEAGTTGAGVIETGAIVMATGSHTYIPVPGEFGYGRNKQVITLEELISQLKKVNIPESSSKFSRELFTWNGRKIRSIAMIHCVGSRQIPGIHEPGSSGYLNEYCSRTCCSAMLNASVTIRKAFPGTTVYEMYRDIRTYGRGQEELYNRAAENKVIFMRFEAGAEPEVKTREELESDTSDNLRSPASQAFNGRRSGEPQFPLNVTVQDTLTFGETFDIPVDLVVLATGVEPNDVSSLVKAMKIPVGTDRFLLEVHPKLRPVEFPVAGIFLAGTCQAPMDAGEASNAAGAAAAKAAALLNKGYIELPPFVAEVNEERCTGCGSCVEACIKEGALNMVEIETSRNSGASDEKVKVARVTPAICLGCGACVAVCQDSAIDLNGWALKQYEKMVDAIVADGMAA
ncbi:Fumarate reductase/succinate dehydrogenase flavoprotein domain protein [Desulfamplus magnetovallimortis]|uniref:Fumarate reductase/succinate dehydrogenase flavoprotein domain protein n=1 Tax=Desulfamplus magnetovallimortis TaxID=1246637 RepID=A0A1W1H6G4_9BACT|nr:FAD-dependent oxidoreductase [Desulfamplus magnetovallimortis]SLM28047.1 Fumarate reductase/succinate dehydrogenase flavoprotein domain protein [Desulfamplus magnetovallimortis]